MKISQKQKKQKTKVGNSYVIHTLACIIRNFIIWAGAAIKTADSLAFLKSSPESRTTTFTAYRDWSLSKGNQKCEDI